MICSQHVRLDEVCQRKTATSDPSARPFASFSYVDIASINTTEKQIDGIKNLLGADAPSRARRLILTGDVLVSMTRPNLNAVAIVPKQLNEMVGSTGFAVLRPGDRLLANYLFQYVQSPGFVARLSALVSGAMYPAVTERQIRSQTIPLPPVEEQRRIVEILNHANRIRRLRREVIAKARELVPALFIQMFGDPASNPKNLPVVPLGELLDACDYGTSRKATSDPVGLPVLRMGNLTTAGDLDLTALKYAIFSAKEADRYSLRAGDLLFNRTNSKDLVGKTGIWDRDIKAVAASYFIRLRISNERVSPWYVWTFFNTKYMKRRLFDTARGAIGQANINARELKAFSIPVPPIALQREFADHVRDVRRLVSQHEQQAAEADALHTSLLSQCFE